MSLPVQFHDIAKRVNNWGRWGADDEIGTLNLITDEVVREAAASVRTGRRVPLALPLQQDGVQTGMMPGRVNPLHAMVQINQEIFGPGTVACSDDAVTMGLQAATHWDALTHVSHSGRIYNGRPADTITPHGGAAFAGIDKARHIVSRGVLLDIPRALGRDDDRLPGDHAVTPEDLDAAEELAGTRVRAGDIVLVRTGQIRTYLAGDKHGYAFPSPGLSVRTPEWFHARDVAAVANDTLTFEIFPPEIEDLWLPVHALHLVEMGMPQGQNWNLEELSTACGQLGRYDFLLSAMPEPFVGATGTPVAPIALL
ncbi:cyclase family protein [Streptomyces stelliscabiei]|uniref:Kynurenine formamidase n=1 Tax=Streptomyces stelliscabiei TaxID=146820 RepID=A0A8I0TRV9_9ACTN|nr:cyclase family protein [Streptomyces stelliscabiei]KND45735.1 cyclase [Streptomyces stelliscabiei]MBE1598084.1 kynurenine formamidase [Streptomyces stelliscabiei]MDX2515591.1 cyclase family protein [Streptomyces stelliscabiei]MDX2552189.1 cyclase family protein [Streptomyces stelliscabiei]MDX2609443.1 cyclase family protein [Streptomyces stelliscabiei]